MRPEAVGLSLDKVAPRIDPDLVRFVFKTFRPDVPVKPRRDKPVAPTNAAGRSLFQDADPATEARLTAVETKLDQIGGMLAKLVENTGRPAHRRSPDQTDTQ